MSHDPLRNTRGPFRADQLRSGDPYELSNGHTVRCMPTGGRGSLAAGAGYKALADDPDVEDVGIDSCRDLPTLEGWLSRAVSAASAGEILE